LEAHFNEGRLKLISIAIYFALAKEYELDSSIKLLVLDDFLTSLDMANRKLIIRYILDDFAEYQKIILTHNIQFFNLIIKLLNMREEKEAWDIKNIFLFEKDKKESADINNKDNSYLQSSRKQLLLGEYHISGNYARKEFERIINEFKQILEIGKMEQLNSILEILKSTSKEDKFYKKPFLVISKLNTRFLNILNILESTQNVHEALGKIKYETKEIKNFLETEKCELLNLKELLTKTEFYKNILFNPTSHSNENIEVYRKECINSIKLLEKLNEILNQLK